MSEETRREEEVKRMKDLLSAVDRPMDPEVQKKARDLAAAHFGGAGDGPDALLKEGELLGNHRIERVLGAGGQAVVYLAHHRHLPARRVAIKVPHGEQSRRMMTEAKVLASLHHPNILGLVDLVPDGSHPHLVVDYCEGGSLADRLEEEGPLSEGEVLRLSRQILDGLGYAHDRGVVHRDLKPENILFDGDGTPRIADFGIGKVVAEQLSLSLTNASRTGLVGTPVYLAPEQERPRASVDGRADLYAFGKLLYQMLTGQLPRTLRPVDRERTGLHPAWTELIFRLTESDPEKRIASAGRVRAEIDAIAAGLAEAETRTGRKRSAEKKAAGAAASDTPKASSATPTSNGEERKGYSRSDWVWWAGCLIALLAFINDAAEAAISILVIGFFTHLAVSGKRLSEVKEDVLAWWGGDEPEPPTDESPSGSTPEGGAMVEAPAPPDSPAETEAQPEKGRAVVQRVFLYMISFLAWGSALGSAILFALGEYEVAPIPAIVAGFLAIPALLLYLTLPGEDEPDERRPDTTPVPEKQEASTDVRILGFLFACVGFLIAFGGFQNESAFGMFTGIAISGMSLGVPLMMEFLDGFRKRDAVVLGGLVFGLCLVIANLDVARGGSLNSTPAGFGLFVIVLAILARFYFGRPTGRGVRILHALFGFGIAVTLSVFGTLHGQMAVFAVGALGTLLEGVNLSCLATRKRYRRALLLLGFFGLYVAGMGLAFSQFPESSELARSIERFGAQGW